MRTGSHLFLGLDCSTQGLTAIVVDADGAHRHVVFEHALDFDRDFSHYHTRNGVWRDGTGVTSSPLMWAEALDRMMGILSRERSFDLRQLKAIAGSAQQHGSVYLNARAGVVWRSLDPGHELAAQLEGTLARDRSPVWMDESTRAQCDAIGTALGGADAVKRLTGSVPTERFTGPQIRKFHEIEPGRYAGTDRVHLVSSYLASLLAGRHAPIDPGDGAGMNLMNISSSQWAPSALDATAPGLRHKLPDIQDSWAIVGTLSPYWIARYGFPAAQVVAWSGDNPCSLVGAGLVSERDLGISLGTSDTVFAFSRVLPAPSFASHVFGSPTGGYMGLVCFKNGSLAREAVRDAYMSALSERDVHASRREWEGFSRALRETPAGNHGAMMLPWFEPEITPRVAVAGVRRSGLDPADANANVRAVVEAQMMAMANHSEGLTGGHRTRIVATGGASANREILQVMADVFDAEVFRAAAGNAACLGAALRAFHAHELSRGRKLEWNDVVAGVTDPPEETRVTQVPAHVAVYRDLRREYAQFESERSQGLDGTAISTRRT